ncbi:MAG: CHAD domain-containing protein [Rhodobacteraceae bacterium]|nr:CHAD domain-containing protein [Paracoccaceae bacterium]
MSYRLKRTDKTLQAALRRIATQEIDTALAEIDAPALTMHDKVHQLRKRAKRLRGLIRLLRPVFPGFQAENAAIREAAAHLSPLRDAEGMVETCDKLIAATGATRFAPVRAELAARRDARAAQDDVASDLAAFRAEMIALRARASQWRLTGDGYGALRPGLEKAATAARKGQRAAKAPAGPAAIHAWRKRVKDHWYHTRLLAPIRPRPLNRRAKRLRALSELLGDHHDLSVLDDFIASTHDLPGDATLRADLRACIHARQRALAKAAQALGKRLFKCPPRKMGKRWRRWWTVWRAG